ncbi:MAG: SpoIIE family protein phosphatase, partial [Bacteroidetes bacterium]|nr:SpoIIE family protein phosphatase [Bacteroidota bacterium]
ARPFVSTILVVAVADCTGHGVPGAFMSMLGIAFLNEVVIKDNIVRPGKILEALRQNVIRALHQTGKEEEAKDGMVAGICTIEKEKHQLIFAGAKTPLFHLRAGILNEIKGDNMPVSIYYRMDDYTEKTIFAENDDLFYLFSDGYSDQFGGPGADKIKNKGLKDLLVSIYAEPMIHQKNLLEKHLNDWMMHINPATGKPFVQVDDILLLGFKWKQ